MILTYRLKAYIVQPGTVYLIRRDEHIYFCSAIRDDPGDRHVDVIIHDGWNDVLPDVHGETGRFAIQDEVDHQGRGLGGDVQFVVEQLFASVGRDVPYDE